MEFGIPTGVWEATLDPEISEWAVRTGWSEREEKTVRVIKRGTGYTRFYETTPGRLWALGEYLMSWVEDPPEGTRLSIRNRTRWIGRRALAEVEMAERGIPMHLVDNHVARGTKTRSRHDVQDGDRTEGSEGDDHE